MNLIQIAWRSITQRRLSSFLTSLSMALGVALVVTVLVVLSVVRTSFQNSAGGYDMIIGAKGGKLQLVLNTVYHLSQPIENIPWDYYKEFSDGQYAPYVAAAVPFCLGDNYKGYRVVGTTPQMFEMEYAPDQPYVFQAGENFSADEFYGAVIGADVARRTGLTVGDQFEPTHGITTEEDQGLTHEPFTVRGVLAPTSTPNDRALFVNLEGFFLLEGHAKPLSEQEAAAAQVAAEQAPATPEETPGPISADGHAPLPEAQREVTAILVRSAQPIYSLQLMPLVNKGGVAQAVSPVREVTSLFAVFVDPLRMLLLVLAWLIVVVSSITVMVAIYNSMSERRREIAVMRALGAGRDKIMMIVLLESILLALMGGIAGVLLGHGLIAAVGPYIYDRTGVSVGFFSFDIMELAIVPGLIVLAALVGYLPAVAAYRTDVAKALSESP